MRRTPLPPDPAAAAAWLDYARYIAGIAQIGPPGASLATLREEAGRRLDDPTRRAPARMILHALDAADEGRAYHPYERWRRG